MEENQILKYFAERNEQFEPLTTTRLPNGRRPGSPILWAPTEERAVRCQEVHSYVLNQARRWPIGVRDVYYEMVKRGVIEKDAQKLVKGQLKSSRKNEGVITDDLTLMRLTIDPQWSLPYDCIDDHLTVDEPGHNFEDASDVIEYLHNFADGVLTLNLQRGADCLVEVWCEERGKARDLRAALRPYGVRVLSSGGFDSLPPRTKAAERYVAFGKPVHILYVGDLDPSGWTIPQTLCGSVGRLMHSMMPGREVDLTIERVAITDAQLAGVPESERHPISLTDLERRKWMGYPYDFAVQVNAIGDKLASAVTEAVLRVLDFETVEARREEQNALRDRLRAGLEAL